MITNYSSSNPNLCSLSEDHPWVGCRALNSVRLNATPPDCKLEVHDPTGQLVGFDWAVKDHVTGV